MHACILLFGIFALFCATVQALSGIPVMPLLGKQKQSLRTIAGRMKLENKLNVLQFKDISVQSLVNLEESLKAHEMIQLKFMNVEKKTDAKKLGIEVAAQTNSALVQVLGHTALLYRASSPSNEVTKALHQELQKIVTLKHNA